MSTALAYQEMRRFLANARPEVLSVSGRWGVGKTHAWRTVLDEICDNGNPPLPRYAYVSAFGVRTIDNLKSLIVQSTVRLDSKPIEPTIQSFNQNLRDVAGVKNLLERGSRKSLPLLRGLTSFIPGAEKAAEFILPGAELFIRNQLVCIDDVERAGAELSVSDILGFVSMLREERSCKVVLLLNDEGLADQETVFRTYLEKVVDQAINYTPTPRDSAHAALRLDDDLGPALANRITALGITNIRVIQRIRRFLYHIEPILRPLHPDVMQQAISTIVLLGWCVFEPKLAPNLNYIKSHNEFTGIFGKQQPTEQEAGWNALLRAYQFGHIDDFDAAILDGLTTGGFDLEVVRREAALLDEQARRGAIRQAISQPWDIYGGSFDDNEDELRRALVASVENYTAEMKPGELSEIVTMLQELGDRPTAERLVGLYMDRHKERPRGFFNVAEHSHFRPLNPLVRQALEDRFAKFPVERDAQAILLKIERDSGWNPDEVEFLASQSEDDFYRLFKSARDQELRDIIRSSLRFASFGDGASKERIVFKKALEALRRIGSESRLNGLRVHPYLPKQAGEDSEASG